MKERKESKRGVEDKKMWPTEICTTVRKVGIRYTRTERKKEKKTESTR